MPAKERPFSAMAKPVGSLCNLQCSYCYYLKSSGPAPAAGQRRMSDETLERYICQYLEAAAGPAVHFVWHGGEPSLAGIDFYRRVVGLQEKYRPEGVSVWNNLQTNGLLLDEAWCAFLAEHHFDVGLSIDGAQWIHDRYRIDATGRGSYKDAAAAIRRLQASGIQPDLLCTVNASTAAEPLEVYRALRSFGTGWIQFIPIVRRDPDGEVRPESVPGEAYGDFLCAVFDEWALHDIASVRVQMFSEMINIRGGGLSGLCWMAPDCGRVLIVEQDGGVYACDHFVAPAYRLGDIYTSRLGELAALPAQIRFGESKRDTLPEICRACSWLQVCNGGCPKDRFLLSDDGEPGANYLCAGLRRFFAHAWPMLDMLDAYAGQGLGPAAAGEALRMHMQAQWKGVGRNDPCPCGSGRKAKHCCWDRRP